MGGSDLIQLSFLIAELSAGSGADIPKIQGVLFCRVTGFK